MPVSALETVSILLSLNDPHLMRVYYAFPTGDGIDVLCEYVAGESLAQSLNDPMKEERAAAICSDICDGLYTLHTAGLVHRDINPNNIIITPDGRAKIIDPGIVRKFSGHKSKDTEILGTPGYAAPEQFGFTQSDARTDIYAVGVLLNVLLTGGCLPNEHLAKGICSEIIEKCTAIDPKNRYASVLDLREDLQHGFCSPLSRLIRHIPGIRSRRPLFIILSVFLYLLWIVFDAAMIYSGIKEHDNLFFLVIGLFLLTFMPFCINHNVFGFRRKPLFRTKNGTTRIWAVVLADILLIIYGFFFIGFASAS